VAGRGSTNFCDQSTLELASLCTGNIHLKIRSQPDPLARFRNGGRWIGWEREKSGHAWPPPKGRKRCCRHATNPPIRINVDQVSQARDDFLEVGGDHSSSSQQDQRRDRGNLDLGIGFLQRPK
jgi:hypothetical protein